MSGIKAKISETVDKLTHKSNKHGDTTTGATGTGYDNTTTGTGTTSGTDYNTTSGTGAGTGLDTASAGTGTGLGTGSSYDTTTGTGATGVGGTTGSEYGATGGTTGATYGGSTGGVAGAGQVIDSETFTKTEDHEVLIEKKQYELEHRPVQKQYVVETKLVGEQNVAGAPTELVGTEAREVDERVKQAPAGNRTVVVENVDVPASELRETEVTGAGYGSGATGTGTTGSGYGSGTGTTGTGSTY